MPRKSIPRAFKLVCKHYKGFDRGFSAKAVATRKFHASQGVVVNQKLAAASDYKHGKTTGRPLVKSYSSTYPSFAAQYLPTHSRCASHLAHLQHTPTTSAQHTPAPSFAAAPLWRTSNTSEDAAASHSPEAASSAEAMDASVIHENQLAADPLYQYAKMDCSQSLERGLARRHGRKQDRSALKWYGSLDRRPISKSHSASLTRQNSRPENSRLAAAFAAYADLDGPKH